MTAVAERIPDLQRRFHRVQQGPYDIWEHPNPDLAVVISRDTNGSGQKEPGSGSLRARGSASVTSMVRGEMQSIVIGLLHPNVLIVNRLKGEQKRTVTAEEIKMPVDPHAQDLESDLRRVGGKVSSLLRDRNYQVQQFDIRVGDTGGKHAIGLGLLSPGTAVILNRRGDPVQDNEWAEMMYDITGVEKTPLDSEFRSVLGVMHSIYSPARKAVR